MDIVLGRQIQQCKLTVLAKEDVGSVLAVLAPVLAVATPNFEACPLAARTFRLCLLTGESVLRVTHFQFDGLCNDDSESSRDILI